MHWLVFSRLSTVRYQGDLPNSLARVQITFQDLASLADSVIEAQQTQHRIRPWVQVKNSLQRQLLLATFQSYEQVGSAFSLAGIDKGWSRTAQALGSPSAEIRDRLNRIVHRRNQIVHEGDIMRASRPRDLHYNWINVATVTDDIAWIERLLNAMQTVTEEGG